jgi:hypothetical protein
MRDIQVLNVPIVRDFHDVFSDELPVVPRREKWRSLLMYCLVRL